MANGNKKAAKKAADIIELVKDERFLERIARAFVNIYGKHGAKAAHIYLERLDPSIWEVIEGPIHEEFIRKGYVFDE